MQITLQKKTKSGVVSLIGVKDIDPILEKVAINDGDLLVVDKSLNPKNFSTVVVNINEELVVKTFIKENNQSFLTSGSKEIKDKINLTENPEVLIWGIVTYVIHALQ